MTFFEQDFRRQHDCDIEAFDHTAHGDWFDWFDDTDASHGSSMDAPDRVLAGSVKSYWCYCMWSLPTAVLLSR